MKRVCVFCGSSLGANPEYIRAAKRLGQALVRRDMELVFGGASVGLIGQVARTVLEEGGEVIGVIARELLKMEITFAGLRSLHVIEDLQQRKKLMSDLSDGFVAMPGGLGTIDELLEVLTWAQLGLHRKPCGLLNTDGYFDKLIDFLNHVVQEQFMGEAHRSMILIDENPDRLLATLEVYQPPPNMDKAIWIQRMNTIVS